MRSPFGGGYANFNAGYGSNPYGRSRFEETAQPFNANYDTPGWQRAQSQWKNGTGRAKGRPPQQIEGELVASSTASASAYAIGARVNHLKFGAGTVVQADGNKLTVEFDSVGQKRVVDSFLQPGLSASKRHRSVVRRERHEWHLLCGCEAGAGHRPERRNPLTAQPWRDLMTRSIPPECMPALERDFCH